MLQNMGHKRDQSRLLKPPPNKSTPEERCRVALQGVSWLVKQRVATPIRRLHRTAGSPEIVSVLEKVTGIWLQPPPVRPFDHRIDEWSKLANALNSLLKRQSLGMDVQASFSSLRKWLEQNPTERWLGDPPRMLVCAHLLNIAGVSSPLTYEQAVERIRNAAKPQYRKDYRRYLGGIIHLLLCESGYLRRRLDAKNFCHELSIIREGLDTYLSTGMTPFEADTAAELVIGCKLLQVEQGESVERMVEWLTQLQETDGAWHPPHFKEQQRIHRTSVTVQAIMAWSEQSRWALDLDY